MDRVFEKIAYRKTEGLFLRVVLSPLYLLSLFYGAAVKVRSALYSSCLLKTREIACKVVSVGNVTVGGTGKTPTVELIARSMKDKGFRTAILSRGYKRKGKGIGVVSDGKTLLLGPEEAGDEPYMLARRLKDVPVLVGSDRYALGMYALERFPLDVVILDDGFQHIRLKRDLDIVIVDGVKCFGNGHMLPRGPLREPLSGIERAGMVLINKGLSAEPEIAGVINEYNPEAAVFRSGYRSEKLVSLFNGEGKGLDLLAGANVVAFAAIANPSSFYGLLSSLGARIVAVVSFPDHFSYKRDDMEAVMRIARADGADFVVTTEKDAVKLEQLQHKMNVPVYYLEIGLDMNGREMEFIDSIIDGIVINQ